MPHRRVVLAVSVFSLLASSVIGLVTPVRAQTGVDEATREAEQAADAVDSAYEIVDAAVSERDAIEDQLFEALDRYSVNAERLSELGTQLTRLDDSLAITEARTVSTRDLFEIQAVTAYIQAVSSEGILIFHSGTVERAMVAGETLRRSSNETLSALDRYLAFSQELGSIREQIAAQRVATDAARQQLEADSAELERLFAAANGNVAEAFDRAQAAEAELARAVDEVRAAELAEAERRREETASTRSTTTTTSTPPASAATSTSSTSTSTSSATSTSSTTTTTTAPSTTTTTPAPPPAEWPPIPISSAVLAWRPVLEQHFAADLVLDSMVIMQCESLGDPNAVNPYSGASGLFQFMPGTWAVASVQAGVGDRSVFDGEANIIAASWLAEYYRSRGYDPWRPWSCRIYLN